MLRLTSSPLGSTIKGMREYETVFIDSQSRLILSIAIVQQSCKELLRDLPNKQVSDLLDRRKGWDDPKLAEVGTLQRRLGERSALYRISIVRLNGRVDLLRKKLKLREDLTVGYLSSEITLNLLSNFPGPIRGGWCG